MLVCLQSMDYKAAVLSQAETRVTTLDNGLRVATEYVSLTFACSSAFIRPENASLVGLRRVCTLEWRTQQVRCPVLN